MKYIGICVLSFAATYAGLVVLTPDTTLQHNTKDPAEDWYQTHTYVLYPGEHENSVAAWYRIKYITEE